MFNSDLYEPALSKEIKSYIDPMLHYLLLLQEELSEQKYEEEVLNYIADVIEADLTEVDLYKLFIIICVYSNDPNLILSVIDNLHLDMNHPYLNNFDVYDITFESLQCAVNRGRDLGLPRECVNTSSIASWRGRGLFLARQLHLDFNTGVLFFTNDLSAVSRNYDSELDDMDVYTPLILYIVFVRPFEYEVAKFYLDNGSDPTYMFDSISPLSWCVYHYLQKLVPTDPGFSERPEILLFISDMINTLTQEQVQEQFNIVKQREFTEYFPGTRMRTSNYKNKLKPIVYELFMNRLE
jgi:hypothetical protein